MTDFQMIDEIKVETKMFKFIDIISVFVIMGFLMLGFMLSGTVYSVMKVPFIIYNGLIGLLFTVKSPWNKDLKVWKSLAIFVRNFFHYRFRYHAIELELPEDDTIIENKLMYNPKYRNNTEGGNTLVR